MASGNKFSGISNIVRAQVSSLENAGLHMDIFAINGKGWFNYFKSILKLRTVLKKSQYCAVHAHYSFATWVALLAGARNVVSSLMGSDVKSKRFLKFLIRYLLTPFCRIVIVKSKEMMGDLQYSKALVIPNGVNNEHFFPTDAIAAKCILNWDSNKLHILFPSDPERKEKNFELLLEALTKCCIVDFEVHVLKDIPYSELNLYYNAADLVCLTSNREGSPNAIKEAMACNKLVVSTKVGDVPWLFEAGEGLFLADLDSDSVANAISSALLYGSQNQMKSNGRDQIVQLGLTSRQVANQLIQVYSGLCNTKRKGSKTIK